MVISQVATSQMGKFPQRQLPKVHVIVLTKNNFIKNCCILLYCKYIIVKTNDLFFKTKFAYVTQIYLFIQRDYQQNSKTLKNSRSGEYKDNVCKPRSFAVFCKKKHHHILHIINQQKGRKQNCKMETIINLNFFRTAAVKNVSKELNVCTIIRRSLYSFRLVSWDQRN